MIGTALKYLGFAPGEDFAVTDHVGNGDRRDFVLKWLALDKPQPTKAEIDNIIFGLEQGILTLEVKKGTDERLIKIETDIASVIAILERIEANTPSILSARA